MKNYNGTIVVIGNNPALSEKIQKMLFGYGYKWMIGSGEVSYTESMALLISHESPNLTYLCEDWDFSQTLITRVVDGRYFTPADIEKIPSAQKPSPPIPVKELTMEELNALSVEKFGYEIKIKARKTDSYSRDLPCAEG